MITVYTKSNCPACMMTKQVLKDKNIDFEEINAEHDDYIKNELRLYGFASFPVVAIDSLDNAFAGFQPDRLTEL